MAAIAALALTACGDREDDGDGDSSASDTPTSTESSPTEDAEQFPDFKACMVSDSGGFDDKSFNQTSHDGMEAAAENYGVQTAEAESSDPSQFADNIDSLVNQDCNQITTVGFLLGDATRAAAKANPDVDFAIVDYEFLHPETFEPNPPPNAKGLTFDTGQPSFLAGYLAAAKSETGVVGTFGGLNIPTVTIFMTGFAQGVEHYNTENDADVKVLGWDPENPDAGSFTNDFEDKTAGQSLAEEMIGQGADVIFPVAGPAGLGGLQAAQDNEVWGIWVDTDGCVSAAEYCDSLLTSVVKGMDVAVEKAILDSASGSFNNEVYRGTLEDGGVSLAPYGPNADVDDELAAEIEDLKQQIISGEITVG
ncbi:BMP family ABC transporter substrate-binding protein [Nocardioides sp. HM23]|uniref:BMP family lipoprotein n=1 Tax=Nocardioides bizhenqiangii TaxID=3095076 RepID=UPI002ACAA18E|nr:BMP family ABC transporter substrate-binding protein [Nocardioides sp. HM23]MDZ5621552.1 BMP family ABC transporter substrate-binding protein [Nocardioides sp. HM23]